MKVKSIIGYSVLGIVGVFLFFKLKNLFSPINQMEALNDAKSLSVSKKTMQNGRTLYEVANEIINHLYRPGLWFGKFSLKDTDEKALGELMLTVRQEEYEDLSNLYLTMKKALDLRPGTLAEDLRRTFNDKEQRMYMSHLLLLP